MPKDNNKKDVFDDSNVNDYLTYFGPNDASENNEATRDGSLIRQKQLMEIAMNRRKVLLFTTALSAGIVFGFLSPGVNAQTYSGSSSSYSGQQVIMAPAASSQSVYVAQTSNTQSAPASVQPTSSPAMADSKKGYSASAGVFDPINARILTDPLYLPLKGQIYGITDYTLDMPTGDNRNGAGVKTASFSSYDNLLEQTVAYGVTDDFTITFEMGFGINSNDSTSSSTGATSTGNSNGFTDPTLSATYRFLDQPRSPVIVQGTASYSPDMLDDKVSGGGHEGTMGRGNQSAGLTLDIGREMNSFSVLGRGGVTYFGQGSDELLSNDNNIKTDPYWQYLLALYTQTRFTERLSLNAGVSYAINENHGISNITSGTNYTYVPSNVVNFNTGLNYHFIPNRLVGTLQYQYIADTNAKNKFASSASDTSVENESGNIVGVKLTYVFN